MGRNERVTSVLASLLCLVLLSVCTSLLYCIYTSAAYRGEESFYIEQYGVPVADALRLTVSIERTAEAALSRDEIVDVETFVRWATYDAFFRYRPNGFKDDDIQVVVTSGRDSLWAIASYSQSAGFDYAGGYVWRVEESPNGYRLQYAFRCLPPVNEGLSVYVWENDSTYIVCGSIAESHFYYTSETDDFSAVSLNNRSCVLIVSEYNEDRISVNNANGYSGYICVLDSEIKDVIILDADGNELLKFTDWQYAVRSDGKQGQITIQYVVEPVDSSIHYEWVVSG